MENYLYEGFHGSKATCGIEIFEHNNRMVVVITELPSNKGTSVTNAIENIINSLVKDYNLDLNNTSFVEHHLADRMRSEDTYDLVGFSVSRGYVSEPTWVRLRDVDLISLGIQP